MRSPLPPCPFCSSEEVELVSSFAGQIITSQLRCRSCNTYFEAIREEFERKQLASEGHPSERHG